MTRWAVGAAEVVRVDDPGFELVLPQDEATTAALEATPWLRPHFVTDDLALVIGSSATVVRAGGAVVVVDPFLAFDDDAALGPRLLALRRAGVEADDVDVVVNTHVDGLGVNVLLDGEPTFPRARYLVPRAELDAMAAGTHADPAALERLARLQELGVLEPAAGDESVAPGVRLEDAPGHNPGHHVVWIEDGGASAVVVGHLFLHPAQIASPETTLVEFDREQLVATRRSLLARCEDADAVLVGPLFAGPGGGRVRAEGDGWRLEV